MLDQTLPVIAIVGRPNVGKSSLFNRMTRRRIAIVHEQSGVTRDRITAPLVHAGRHFMLVDTGGLGLFLDERGSRDQFDAEVRAQIEAVVREAARIIWILDVRAGVTPMDDEVARLLRQAERPVLVVGNKADNVEFEEAVRAEFSGLGFGEPQPLSCTQNRGVSEIMDWCVDGLQSQPDESFHSGLNLAVVGRPNVGKSSFVNCLLGEDRVIVSSIPGTTRDAIDIPVEIVTDDDTVALTLIDTAGLRRRRQVDNVVELFSVMRAENAIRRGDIVLLMLDAANPATAQDRRIARLVADARKPCIILANKWDIAGARTKLRTLRKHIRTTMAFMDYAPIIGVCAVSGYNVKEVIEHLLELREQLDKSVPTAVFNQFIHDLVERTPPPNVGRKRLKIYYATMIEKTPPRFLVFVNDPGLCPRSYQAFLENSIRDTFYPELGLPVTVEMRARRTPVRQATDGKRQAVSGIRRQQDQNKRAADRHKQRRERRRKK